MTYIAKKQIALLAVVVTMLSACTTNDDDIAPTLKDKRPTDNTTLIEATPENSDIPILFGKAEGFSTRSPYLAKQVSNDHVGVFCIASQGIDGTPNSNIVWDGSASATLNTLNLWMVNVKARISTSVDNNGEGTLEWLDGSSGYYYPKSSSSYNFAYSFAAYYPYSDRVKTTANSVDIIYSGLDGSTDVVTAMSTIDNDEDGNGIPDEDNDLALKAFSASYYENGGSKKPKFTFRHRMTRLIVKMRLSDSYSGSDEFWVNDAWITNLPDSIHLPVITLQKSGTTATVSRPESLHVYTGSTSTYTLRDQQGHQLSETTDDTWKLGTSAKQIGNAIIIPPLCRGTIYTGNDMEVTDESTLENLMKLNIGLQLRKGDGTTSNLHATLNPPTNGWEPGRQYGVTIVVTPGDGDTGPDAQSQTDPTLN
ncbi:MAG: fimbrillin family protein [Prevotella sp.]|nr:fimbrillin family protein [Prevotella sp.]